MSCNRCHQTNCTTPNACYEARLSLGFDEKKERIVGSLDGVSLTPLKLKPMVAALETNTSLRYDPVSRSLVFENEKSRSGTGYPDTVSVSSILSGAQINDLGGVGQPVDGGLASISLVDGVLQMVFEVPAPAQVNELAEGFVTYVPDPISGGHYKTIKPAPGGTADSLLLGHPNGSIEFAVPIDSPLRVDVTTLTDDGAFNGSPAVSSGAWRYQTMGTSQVITNASGSDVEVELYFRFSMTSASGTHNGVYGKLVNGGSDYQTEFVENVSTIKQESYPGGQGRFRCVLSPNQKCQFEFGGFANASGNMKLTIGNTDEGGETVVPPVITIRRLV